MNYHAKKQRIVTICLPAETLAQIDKRAGKAGRSQADQIVYDLDRLYRGDRANKENVK